MRDNFKIVDVHTHTYAPEKSEQVLNTFASRHRLEPTCMASGKYEDLLSIMQGAGIDYAVLANFAPLKILHKNNLWTLSLAKENKNFIPLVGLHPEMEGELVDILKQYLDLGAKGIKMHNILQEYLPGDIRLRPLYDYCNKHRVPITFHCGSLSRVYTNSNGNIEHFIPVFDEYGNIPFNVTHMAEGKLDDLIMLKDKYKNLYFDTSMTISGKHCIHRIHQDFWEDNGNVVKVIREIGCERILFGSDYPFGSPADDLNRFLSMDFTNEEKAMILGKNALKLYNLI